MNKPNTTSKIENNVHIEQNTPQNELNNLEKTTIFQFLKEENILKEKNKKTETIKQKIIKEDIYAKINSNETHKTIENELEMPKRKNNLSNTIKIKLSDLRAAVRQREKEELERKRRENKNKSLYDTIIIKLDDIINNRKALKCFSANKVIKTELPLHHDIKKEIFDKVKDITKIKKFTLNVDSEEFMNQINNLNIIALTKLSTKKNIKIRDYKKYKKKYKYDKVKIKKEDFLSHKDKLIEYATDKLYYQYALKETAKYKMYKTSVALSALVFLTTSVIILSWFIQGVHINNLSNSLVEVAPIEKVDDGDIVNVEIIDNIPAPENNTNQTENKEETKKQNMYWQYLNTPLSSVDFTQLLKQNKDTIGWLIVNNTNINYPVVQTTNNDYYLSHSFNRSKNYAGWVYADFRNNFKEELSKNTVIYAHGRKDGVMFGSLMNTLKKNWYTKNENQIIQFSTLKYNTMWQIFSIYKIEAESYYITTDFSTETSFEEFINTMKSRSIYDFGTDVGANDKILTLSTCYNDKGIRLVVQAKLVKIQTR